MTLFRMLSKLRAGDWGVWTKRYDCVRDKQAYVQPRDGVRKLKLSNNSVLAWQKRLLSDIKNRR